MLKPKTMRSLRGQNILVTMLAIASVLIFCLTAVAEEQKIKVSITDPECHFVGLSQEDLSHFSSEQQSLFYGAFEMLNKGELTKAVEKFKELSAQVKKFEIEYDLGLTYAKQGDLENAELALKRAIKIYNRYRESYKILSLVQKALGKKRESDGSMGRYLQL